MREEDSAAEEKRQVVRLGNRVGFLHVGILKGERTFSHLHGP